MLSGHALVVLAVVAAGALLHFPALDAGYLTDDYAMHAMLDGRYPVARAPLDLYRFARPDELPALVDHGVLPWWSHPELSLAALRPLASALIWLEHSLGLSAFARHAHSLGWWVALIVAYAIFVGRALPRPVALLATVLFALDPAHGVPIAWIANRTSLISAFFGVLALAAHLEWRERGVRAGAWLAGVAALLSLAAGEYGVCALAYLLSYELCAGPGSRGTRARALLPAGIPLILYAAFYRLFGYGAVASSMYLDPLAQPKEFLLNALGRFPALLVNEILTVPGEVTLTAMVLGQWGILALLLPLAAVAWLVWGLLRRAPAPLRRMLLALLVGTLLSLLPLVGTIPSTRILLVPSVGGAALIAAVFWDTALRVASRGDRRRPVTWLRLGLTSLLVPFHVAFAPAASRLGAVTFQHGQALLHSTIERGELDGARAAQRDYVLLNAPEPMLLLYVPYVLYEAGRTPPRSWRALAMTSRPLRVRRTAADTLELSAEGGLALENPIVHLFRRGDQPLREGQVVRVRGLELTVVTMQRWGPSRFRARFDRSLDDPTLVLMTISAVGLRRQLPPPVGGELRLGD